MSSKLSEFNIGLLNRKYIIYTLLLLCCIAWVGQYVGQHPNQGVLLAYIGSLLLLLILFVPFIKPINYLYLLIFAIMFLSGIERGFIIPGMRLNEPILLFVAFAIISRQGLKSFQDHEAIISVNIIDLLFLILLVGRGVIPFLWSLFRGITFGLDEAITVFAFLQHYLIFRLVLATVKNENSTKSLTYVLIFCGVVISFIAVLQIIDLFGVRNLITSLHIGGVQSEKARQAYVLSRGRAFSLLGSWNTLGSLMSMHLVLILSLMQALELKRSTVYLLVIAFLVDLIGLIASGSFTGLIIFVLGLFLMQSILGKGFINWLLKPKILLLVVFAIVLALAMFGQNIQGRLVAQYSGGQPALVPQTLEMRINLWKSTFLPYIAQNWDQLILGLGPTALGIEENYYLYLIMRYGLPGLIAYIVFIIAILKRSLISSRSSEGMTKALALATFIMLGQISLASLSARYFDYSGVSETLWITLGLWIASERL
jgi:hypothetical protein